MRFRMCVREALLSCVLAGGFVMQAQAEDQPTSEAAAPVTPTNSSSPPATPATETTTVAVTPATDEAEKAELETVEFERVAKQYQKTEKDGQTLYCRKEKTLGTRIAKPVCLTASQLRDRIRAAEEARGVTKPQVGGCRPPIC